MRALRLRKISARPQHHAQDPEQAEAFKKENFVARLAEVARARPPDTPVEIWFADEARIGQKNTISRRWAV